MTEKAKTRFWKKVLKTEGCWLWTASLNSSGYGYFSINSAPEGAHRVSWRMHNGPIPTAMHVLHKCDVPACVNPEHLFIGTHADNLRDMVHKGRKTSKSKLTRGQVLEIREKYVPIIYSTYKLAEEYGVSQCLIYQIVTRKKWKHL